MKEVALVGCRPFQIGDTILIRKLDFDSKIIMNTWYDNIGQLAVIQIADAWR
jgi:hypothetical protein